MNVQMTMASSPDSSETGLNLAQGLVPLWFLQEPPDVFVYL